VAEPSAAPTGRRAWLVRRGPWLVLALVALFLLIQLVPYRLRNHPVAAEPNWDSPRTRALAVAACFDCHSNQTRRYWYEQVAPISWWITNHVDEGRAALNFSECRTGGDGLGEAAETINERSMPPAYYTWLGLHSGARLSATERRELADGLAATARRGCR
jgi:Haem-binding domain